MMNQDNPYAMNQTCKVCGEPAAGFHFGAFTCEGCKSFFGRSYNNLSSISDCKNNGECIINKKNRTACKACRLRKCLLVGMSKSGSRYGRRSNWFKIHCLLQEQQQQAAAVMAAHHNNQHQQQAAAAAAAAAHQAHGMPGVQKHPASSGQSQHAAAAALGMLSHAGAYPGLYPPRTKEELMMLGLDVEYVKHSAASPSVSSPDSHNSDSSIEVTIRGNPLLHLSGKHLGGGGGGAEANTALGVNPSSQLRKDLPPFLPLPFPGLASMPVMPPPALLPHSHFLFPGYHPALYQHHQGLLKPSPEQQQAVAAAAAVQHLFNSTNAAPTRFTPTTTTTVLNTQASPLTTAYENDERLLTHSPKRDTAPALNNNHITNGSKTAADELTKRFYLDAVLKSQQQQESSPPPTATIPVTTTTTTKLPGAHSKHDHSISALVTPNSESGRERLKSRQSNDDSDEHTERVAAKDAARDVTNNIIDDVQSNGQDDSDCGEDLVVSMTPPRSPVNPNTNNIGPSEKSPTVVVPNSQDNPIDLSMKCGSSVASSLSSKCSSSANSVQAIDSENENEMETEIDATKTVDVTSLEQSHEAIEVDDVDTEIAKNNSNSMQLLLQTNSVKSNNNNNNNNNNNSSSSSSSKSDNENFFKLHDNDMSTKLEDKKRKLEAMDEKTTVGVVTAEEEMAVNAVAAATAKRIKMPPIAAIEKATVKISKITTLSNALDLTTKV